jgi:hypothetical protein
MMLYGTLWTWVQDWDIVQRSLFGLAGFCFLVILLIIIRTWWRNREIEQLPNMIERLDSYAMTWIDDSKRSISVDDWQSLMRDYGTILGFDFRPFTAAMLGQDQKRMDEQLEKVLKAYNKKFIPEQTDKLTPSIITLRDMAGVLDKYDMGLKALKDTSQYQLLHSRIRVLQRQLPSALISARINEFFIHSDGYYCLLIATQGLLNPPTDLKMPTKILARREQIRPLIEGQIATLITAIREGIIAYKDRNSTSPRM